MASFGLVEEVNVQAPTETVFELVGNSVNWPIWTPISSVEIEREPDPDGIGEVRLFRMGPARIREQIVEREVDRRYSYVLLAGLPVDDYRVDIDLQPEFGGCSVRWRTAFEPKVRGTGQILVTVLGEATRRMLRGLSAESESRALAS